MKQRWVSRACVGSKRSKWRYGRGGARAPAVRLVSRRANRGGHPHLRIEGRSTSWALYNHFAVLVCCANRHAPKSTCSIGFCIIWVCISSSSSSPFGRSAKRRRPTVLARPPLKLLTRELPGRKGEYKRPNSPHFHRETYSLPPGMVLATVLFLHPAAAFATRNRRSV